jgi:hypothetical protein
MRKLIENRRAPALAVAVLVAILATTAIAVAVGSAATDSRAGTVKVKCPKKVLSGRKVTCRIVGPLPGGTPGPRGPKGDRGARGEKGAKGDRGATGAPGVSGYEVVSQTFKEVLVPDSQGQRGLSEVKTVVCPGGKRALGGGADLGTNPGQAAPQRQVAVSLSAPNGTGNGWSAQLFNSSTSASASIDLRVFAICASTG